ncbi:MAG: cysteine peptidase family C39 domain-containing protein [Erysipelotrichaceae bacterium]
MNCGIACILDLAKRYGIVVGLEEIPVTSATKPLSMAELLTIAEQLSLPLCGMECSQTNITLPCIAHLALGKGHFVVIVKKTRYFVCLGNGLQAKVWIPCCLIEKVWTKRVFFAKNKEEYAIINV